MPKKLLPALLLAFALVGCAAADSGPHVRNDPGGGASGAVSSDEETHGSGSLNGYGAANGDPITNTGNLGSGSTASDPAIGINQKGAAVPF